jgi:hypothetical protein
MVRVGLGIVEVSLGLSEGGGGLTLHALVRSYRGRW